MVTTSFESEHLHNFDDKGRIILPARMRESYGSKCVLSKGLEACIDIYPLDVWEALVKKLEVLSDFNRKNRDFKRRFFSGSEQCDVDKQGRILIRQEFRNHANLTKEVYVVGVGNHLQIWDKVTWEKYRSGLDEGFESLAEEILA